MQETNTVRRRCSPREMLFVRDKKAKHVKASGSKAGGRGKTIGQIMR